jgi:hypothetical protein
MVTQLFAELYHLPGFQASAESALPSAPVTKKRKVTTKAAAMASLVVPKKIAESDEDEYELYGGSKGQKAKSGTGYAGVATEDVSRRLLRMCSPSLTDPNRPRESRPAEVWPNGCSRRPGEA